MQYYKLKISLNEYEDKLNRTILFNYNNDLDDLAYTILSIFNTLASHLYMFKDDKDKYECEISLFNAEEMGYPDVGKSTFYVTLDMLNMKNNKFKMIYDFGDNYEFVIEILELVELDEIFRIPRVIDGKGYGIIEDGKHILEDYLNGKPLEYPLLFIKRGRFTQVDFDSFDLVESNKKIKREFAKIRNAYSL